jgi:hypothetical protein
MITQLTDAEKPKNFFATAQALDALAFVDKSNVFACVLTTTRT